jgi:hypothetical protein
MANIGSGAVACHLAGPAGKLTITLRKLPAAASRVKIYCATRRNNWLRWSLILDCLLDLDQGTSFYSERILGL